MPQPVLIIASAYSPENVIGALRPIRFAKYLPQFGYSPIVVTASAQHQPQPGVFEVPFRFSFTERVLGRTLFPGDERMTWISPVVEKAGALIKENRINLVFSTSPPVSVHMAAAALKRRHGLKWIADFRDPLVDNFARTEFAHRFDPFAERYLAQRMDLAILNTDALAARWKQRYPFLGDRIRYLFNGFDPTEEIGPLPLPQRPHQLWLHAGSIYIMRYPERLFAALDSLHKSKRLAREVRLSLVGYIPDEVLALSTFQNLTAAGVIECNPKHVPQPEARRRMSEADGLVVFDHYSPAGNLQVPAKTYEYIRIGRPILAFSSRGAPLERVLQRCGIANTIIYEEDPPETIERKLVEYCNLPREPRQPSDSFLSDFNVVTLTKRLAEMFDGILKP